MKKPLLCCILFILILLSPAVAFGQNAISGRVTDEGGNPVAGAAVTMKEVRGGTVTGNDGRFSISVPAGGKTLVVSFSGYETNETTISPDQTSLNVVLKEEAARIEQIVVTGYSQTTMRKTTGSIGVISADDIAYKPQTSIDALMQGELAGVRVSSTSGRPGAQQTIRIRGIGNLSGSTRPLWIVDGVPLQNESVTSNMTSGEILAAGFDDLFVTGVGGVNPGDIESINVLKDASAASIYGSRAANGVIVVTTKRGKEGRMKVNFNSNVTVSFKPQRRPEMMNSAEKLAWEQELWDEFAAEKFRKGVRYPVVGIVGQIRSGQIEGIGNDTAAQDDYIARLSASTTDWNEIIMRNAVSTNGHLSISGGSEKNNYYVALGYTNDQGMLIEDSADRYTFKTNLGFTPTKRLTIDVGVDIAYRRANTPNPSVDPFKYAHFANPYEKPYNEDGTYANDQTYLSLPNSNGDNYTELPKNGFNIIREIKGNKTLIDNLATEARLGMDYKIVKSLKIVGLASYRFANNETEKIREEDTYGAYRDRLSIHKNTNEYLYGTKFQNWSKRSEYLLRSHLHYAEDLGRGHYLTMIAGAEIRGNNSRTIFNKRFNYDPSTGDTGLPPIKNYNESIVAEIERLSGEYYAHTRYASFYLSGDYTFKDRYMLSATVRADGSSHFGTHAQFNPNWSVGAAWIVSDEPFMEAVRGVMNYVKLKASYGFTGNVITSAYPQLLMEYKEQYYRQYDGVAYRLGKIDSAPNPNLGWEKTNDYKIGLDLEFIGGRLGLETEYYYRYTDGAVDEIPLYYTTGFAYQKANFARVRNTGVEFTLRGAIIQTNDWLLNTSVNISLNSNKILRQTSSVSFAHLKLNYYEGYPARALIGGKVKGIDPLTGLYEFELRPDAVINSDADYTQVYNYLFYLGNREAPLNGGFNVTAGYKNIRLSIGGTFSHGAICYDRNETPADSGEIPTRGGLVDEAQTEFSDLYANHLNVLKDRTDRWTETNRTGTKYPRIYDIFDTSHMFKYSNPMENSVTDGIYLYEVSYVRIKNITLSYTLPQKLLGRSRFDHVSFNVNLANFFTFTGYEGMDPEVPGSVYPTTRSITVGINLGF